MNIRRILVVTATALLLAAPAWAADVLLGIEGQPPFEIFSYSFGTTQSGTTAYGGGGGAGKASFSDLKITKPVDGGSPLLMLSCAEGRHLRTVTLTIRKPGLPQETVVLSDVLVTSFSQATDGKTLPVDTVSFTYARIEFTSGQTKAGWDLKTNRRM